MDFLKARKSLQDLYQAQYTEKRNWYKFAMVELVIICVLVLSLVVVAKISKPYPWVVQIDEHGYDISVGVAGKQEIDQRVVISRIGQFVQNTRTVITDPEGQKALIDWSFTAVSPNTKAFRSLDDFYRNNDPYKLGRDRETVDVQVIKVLPQSDKTFQAEWVEIKKKDGIEYRRTHWSGLFVIDINPTTDVKNIVKNPLGIYITEYTVSQDIVQEQNKR